jgi:hypothetical protein
VSTQQKAVLGTADDYPDWPAAATASRGTDWDPFSISLALTAGAVEIALLLRATQLGITVAECAAGTALACMFFGRKARRLRRVAIGVVSGFAVVALAAALLLMFVISVLSRMHFDPNVLHFG